MPITSSQIVENFIQIDGRRYIRERHIDHLGENHFITYLHNGNDYDTILLNRVVIIEEQLKLRETNKNINAILEDRALTFNHITLNDFAAVIRIIFLNSRGEISCRIAKWLLERTDAQLRTIFSITQGQVSGLRTRLQAKIDKLNAILNEVGE